MRLNSVVFLSFFFVPRGGALKGRLLLFRFSCVPLGCRGGGWRALALRPSGFVRASAVWRCLVSRSSLSPESVARLRASLARSLAAARAASAARAAAPRLVRRASLPGAAGARGFVPRRSAPRALRVRVAARASGWWSRFGCRLRAPLVVVLGLLAVLIVLGPLVALAVSSGSLGGWLFAGAVAVVLFFWGS